MQTKMNWCCLVLFSVSRTVTRIHSCQFIDTGESIANEYKKFMTRQAGVQLTQFVCVQVSFHMLLIRLAGLRSYSRTNGTVESPDTTIGATPRRSGTHINGGDRLLLRFSAFICLICAGVTTCQSMWYDETSCRATMKRKVCCCFQTFNSQ